MLKSSKTHSILGWISFIAISVGLYMAFIYAPVAVNPSTGKAFISQKIFYFHVASAWNAFLAFFVVFIASIGYLKNRNPKWDIVAKVSAEIGVVFTTIVLATGPIWARAAWNRWWDWEPRLTTTMILWFIYLAYVLIRSSSLEGEKKATMAAVFGIIGFLDVPIVFFAIKWWGSRYHPVVLEGAGGGGLAPTMLQALIVSVIAFTFLYFYLLQKGIYVEHTAEKVKKIKEKLRAKTH
ncbi:cytochrome c biogenesis protein [Metallumcola ferriviriculae]|uniref:Heme exporter protein C n=1 Tax=Metallumcola ferriviriculae TaxID=3039180 RepID=A0AAU0UKK3_9FIRM|nr:cytochrome c biogenesis protein [Desulfitibacteraceae bacterium MK1]